ncbi:bifunctional alpha,alpha-trehalose-phosphate synthase (UDP-forming)/trehalose-phosphatase [Mucilaginibacter sp. 21P]|uniref:bifunctional alpha,alpha-trehalose-phosphate synthase (UDP-forming)/trehalose-phosphatase n=1 Tax=Mucilaginibacter sp. 21P TaxID=2778902 RepID=UPI001C572E67|nr:bifunctional alpha,alpha-trehalose-phosphate synthase (UDP-forming)/trehalose-phosphatase [Mucilaginibacter sp. 21P]QXV66756.1 bifunctional alpha,alpha-trehalose-phosphate synthase (UDP-forming)/trehalose-phosphatase [Mucilaginibacter sp. 21P]
MSKLLIISNRLPLTIEKHGETYTCRQSSGGLVSAIDAFLSQTENDRFNRRIWVGVSEYPEKTWMAAIPSAAGEYEFLPIFTPAKQYDQYYNGFSNSVIWPLFHYFPSFADYTPSFYESYKKVNAKFAEELAKVIDSEDTVWIHDYHLLPLSGMLRKQFPRLTIGFFLHIPFPSYELFRQVPREWQQELLQGMLGADVIGFHTTEYLKHFCNCVSKVLKTPVSNDIIYWQDREICVKAIPIGIDYEKFQEKAADRTVLLKRSEYLRSKQDRKLIFSVDRLDYTKGIFNRLKGYREFLVQNPGYRGKVVFTLVIVPSRDNISKYAERKRMIDEYIGNFNSRFGNISWQPVIYQYGHLTVEELVGMYTACDLALITPIRDGMNLVAKEFIASRRDRQGVLVLSEMAGAAEELTEALLINPNDRLEIARMIRQGLEMSTSEQEARMTAMQEKIRTSDVNNWATSFFHTLDEVKDQQQQRMPKLLDNFAKARLLEDYKAADRKLFLLDYDGTLAPFCADPQLAAPSPEVLQTLAELSADPGNEIYVVSGRDSDTLAKWLGHLRVGLIAEHGLKQRSVDEDWKKRTGIDPGQALAPVQQLMERFTQTCPGSFVECKEASVAWHYRKSDLTLGPIKAAQLHQLIEKQIDASTLSVLQGHKVLEVKAATINKGNAVTAILHGQAYDFLLCAGDDRTDEDMFRQLRGRSDAFTIKIGAEASLAEYNLLTPYLMLELLQRIAVCGASLKQNELSTIK